MSGRRTRNRLIRDERQCDLLAWLASQPVLKPRVARNALFDVAGWLKTVGSEGGTAKPLPLRIPIRYPWMSRADAELGLKYREEDAVSDANNWHRLVGVRVLQQAWADAAWQYSEIEDASTAKWATEKRDKVRRRRELNRLSGVGFFFAPPAPEAWGWQPTLAGWCDVLDLNLGLVLTSVEFHLRALGLVHCRLIDAARADLVHATPGRRQKKKESLVA